MQFSPATKLKLVKLRYCSIRTQKSSFIKVHFKRNRSFVIFYSYNIPDRSHKIAQWMEGAHPRASLRRYIRRWVSPARPLPILFTPVKGAFERGSWELCYYTGRVVCPNKDPPMDIKFAWPLNFGEKRGESSKIGDRRNKEVMEKFYDNLHWRKRACKRKRVSDIDYYFGDDASAVFLMRIPIRNALELN